MLCHRDDHKLGWRNPRRDDQAPVIAVDHNHGADYSSRKPPRRLMHMLKFPFSVRILDAECLGKTVPQMV
ncbi:Uncharacterised protein [Mycobacteroides abscessus subsp. abscessus]|nr:Uncharacterised protein [Mycobacteroides abscessus subsp. abscessus]